MVFETHRKHISKKKVILQACSGAELAKSRRLGNQRATEPSCLPHSKQLGHGLDKDKPPLGFWEL